MTAAIGLQPTQDVRGDELAQGRVGRRRAIRKALHEAGEGLGRAEQARIKEIEDRPQVAKIILDWRAGERDAALGVERLDGAGLLGVGVLDRLRLVDNGEPPSRLGRAS